MHKDIQNTASLYIIIIFPLRYFRGTQSFVTRTQTKIWREHSDRALHACSEVHLVYPQAYWHLRELQGLGWGGGRVVNARELKSGYKLAQIACTVMKTAIIPKRSFQSPRSEWSAQWAWNMHEILTFSENLGANLAATTRGYSMKLPVSMMFSQNIFNWNQAQ